MFDIFEINNEHGQFSFWKNEKNGDTTITISTAKDGQAGLTINAEEFERLKKWINEDD